jgi:hypothetical protein
MHANTISQPNKLLAVTHGADVAFGAEPGGPEPADLLVPEGLLGQWVLFAEDQRLASLLGHPLLRGQL